LINDDLLFVLTEIVVLGVVIEKENGKEGLGQWR